MDKLAVRKIILPIAALFLLLACELPVLSQPVVSEPAPGSIETIVFQTAAAAQTQTAILLPSPTNTPTFTPLPTNTPTETATPTETFIFILPTSTKPFEPYSAGSNCELVALTPHMPVLAPRELFETEWTLKNTGDELWLDQNIDFKHSSGTDMHKQDLYDLPKSVPADGQVTITVPMFTPKNPGTYTSTWVLSRKKTTLCKVSVTVIVK
jgi:hypothetical protein